MDSVTIGERIALLRKKNGYTQQQLADILSISSKTVSRWETGEGFPEISIIPNLTKTLGVSIDQLLEDTNNEYWEKQYKNYLEVRKKFYPNGVPAYEEIGNTAYITFDNFNGVPKEVDY
ncbi:MAG: helix-turn-helix domain-containing protein, partial [Firmicutes bacterium]|nr:helix-turn-helix domain-containing protein [Bacillota bacterium]